MINGDKWYQVRLVRFFWVWVAISAVVSTLITTTITTFTNNRSSATLRGGRGTVVKRVQRGSYDRRNMHEDDERQAPRGLAFFAKSQLLSNEEVGRALKRMAHEIVERNHELSSLSLIGLQTGGEPFARQLAFLLGEISGESAPVGLLDVSFYRDDLSLHPAPQSSLTLIDHDLTNRSVVLVDDVLFTGRTIRAALNALTDWGRPRSVQLAVMVDRGHRELPIRPDYVGKNLPTSRDEAIKATLDGVWIGTRGKSE